jgi:hypothetical protein
MTYKERFTTQACNQGGSGGSQVKAVDQRWGIAIKRGANGLTNRRPTGGNVSQLIENKRCGKLIVAFGSHI